MNALLFVSDRRRRLCAGGCGLDLDELGKRSDADTCGGPCRARKSRRGKAAQSGVQSAQKRTRRARSGVTLSYRKTLGVVAAYLDEWGFDEAEAKARELLRLALSERARDRVANLEAAA